MHASPHPIHTFAQTRPIRQSPFPEIVDDLLRLLFDTYRANATSFPDIWMEAPPKRAFANHLHFQLMS